MINGVSVIGSFCFSGFPSLFQCLQHWDNYQFFGHVWRHAVLFLIQSALTMLFQTYKTIVHMYLLKVHKSTLNITCFNKEVGKPMNSLSKLITTLGEKMKINLLVQNISSFQVWLHLFGVRIWKIFFPALSRCWIQKSYILRIQHPSRKKWGSWNITPTQYFF